MYGHQLSGNLKALYDEWRRSSAENISLHFLSLDPDYGAHLEQQGINVLRCNRVRDMLVLRKATAMVTDHGLHAMTPLVRFTNIKFIDVWHGIPFKGFVPNDFKLQHRYDEVWVSSPLLKDIYQDMFGFNPGRVYALGYARADKLFRRDKPHDDLHGLLGIPAGRRIVLYAPTWRQDDSGRELFPFGETQESFVRRLGRICGDSGAMLVVRSHLNASITDTPVDNVVYCSMKDYADTEELLLHANTLLCDWSSIAFDYLALARPTIFLDVKPPFKNGFSLGPEYRFGAVVSDMDALENELASALLNPDVYQETHRARQDEVREAAYGKLQDGQSSKLQISRLGRIQAY
jgi:CDP-glycerol glycerophosphotransferase